MTMRLSHARSGVTLAFWTDANGVDHSASLYGSYASPGVVAEVIKSYAEDAPEIEEASRHRRGSLSVV